MSILRHKQIDPYDTGSFLLTASVSLNTITFTKGNGSTFPIVINSGSFSGSFSGSLYGTASWAISASFALTAAAAPLDTYIQYNKNGLLGAEQYLRYIYTSHSLQQGYNTTASGQYSHAEGYLTQTIGDYSHVSGYYSIASGSYQFVIGQNNIALDSQSAFIIGDGANELSRHNLLFASQSWFELNAPNTYFQNLPLSSYTPSQAPYVLTYQPSDGRVYYSANVLSIPAPKVVLKGIAPLQWLSGSNEPGGDFNLYRTPQVIANDLPSELINTYPTFVEMVYHKTNKKGKSWVVPVSNVDIGGKYVNTLEYTLQVPLKTRGGNQKYKMYGNTIPAVYAPLNINRPNHYQVTGSNQVIPVYEYLNGYFTKGRVQYRIQLSPFENFSNVECLFPYFNPQVGGGGIGAGYGYSSIYSPLYIAFRYILWDANANNGLGEFISGPLSKTVAIAAPIHPFITNKNNTNVLQPLASVNPNYLNKELKCWFSHKIG